MKTSILTLLILFSSSAFAQNYVEFSGSFKPLSGDINIGPSKASIEMNKIALNFKFSENFSSTVSRFWNSSTVEIYNLSLNYEYKKEINERLSFEPMVGIGIAYYQESTPIQPNISTPGVSLNSELRLGIKLNEKLTVLPGLYYHFMSFSQGFLSTKRDNDIIVDQLGLQLGVRYSW